MTDDELALQHARALLSDACTILQAQTRLLTGLATTAKLCGVSIAGQCAIILAAADLQTCCGRLHEARGAESVFLDRSRDEAKRLMTLAANLAINEQRIVSMPVKASA